VTEHSSSDLSNVYCLRLNNLTAQHEKSSIRVSPIIVKFTTKVFKAKAILASTGIFVSDSLTKRHQEILNAAKDK